MTLADQAAMSGHDGQVGSSRPKRRTFTAAYKSVVAVGRLSADFVRENRHLAQFRDLRGLGLVGDMGECGAAGYILTEADFAIWTDAAEEGMKPYQGQSAC